MLTVRTLRLCAGLLLPGVVAALAVGLSADDLTIPRVPNPPLASDLTNLPGDLRAIAVPGPANLADFVKDPAAALVLGKALLGHAGRERPRAGLRQLSLPGGRRSAIAESTQSWFEARGQRRPAKRGSDLYDRVSGREHR